MKHSMMNILNLTHFFIHTVIQVTHLHAQLQMQHWIYLQKKNIIQKNKSTAKYISEKFSKFKELDYVSDVRQTGMITAVELAKDKKSKKPYNWKERRGIKAYKFGLENNVILRPLGNVIYFMPPYIINKSEINHVVDVVEGAIKFATK